MQFFKKHLDKGLFLLITSVLASGACAIFNYETDYEVNYKNLETVARLVKGPTDQAYYTGYIGTLVHVETRDRETKKAAWRAQVQFRPQGEISQTNSLPSMVIVFYFTVPGYFNQNRDYGGQPDNQGPPLLRRGEIPESIE